ncbi:Uncharacterized protein OBRU01_24838 [Operophtera brumata]|uniref:HTH CENPB-type domain-containing protein n=1 Tax=Operophtera brumata TaxID=104452 RepID=A0A0L7KKP5_OPEBR|nr:Uncharacterized protein OBRU01_24838 [Operophtera brumata]
MPQHLQIFKLLMDDFGTDHGRYEDFAYRVSTGDAIMPRVPSGTRKIGNTPAENIKEGIQLIRNGESMREAAKRTGVPLATLRRYFWKTISNPSVEELLPSQLQPNYGVNKIFTPEQETTLENYFKHCALLFYGLTAKESRRVAYQCAKINNLKMPASWEVNEMAGKDWLLAFRRKHNITLEKPEACSLAGATAFNRKFRDAMKAGPRKSVRKRRRLGRNVIATDTPEKTFIEEEKNAINRKNEAKKGKFPANDDEIENQVEFQLADSEDDADCPAKELHEHTDDNEPVLSEEDLNNTLPFLPKKGEYVIVQRTTKKQKSLCIGKVIKERNSDLEYYISFLRRKPGTDKFLMPNKPDLSLIKDDDLKYILPKPLMKI